MPENIIFVHMHRFIELGLSMHWSNFVMYMYTLSVPQDFTKTRLQLWMNYSQSLNQLLVCSTLEKLDQGSTKTTDINQNMKKNKTSRRSKAIQCKWKMLYDLQVITWKLLTTTMHLTLLYDWLIMITHNHIPFTQLCS